MAIGEVVRSVAKGDAQEAYGIDQLCGSLQAGREGGVQPATLLPAASFSKLFATKRSTSQALIVGWGSLLIVARNAFNEIIRTMMPSVIRHEWP